MDTFLSAAFPQSAYPNGWFAISESREIPVGEVKPLKYFGRDLVLWRGESGALYLMDANCRHLGAHMGYRGDEEQRKLVPAVVGEDLACPWHAWRWNGEGRNTCIPYKNEKPKTAARIRTYPVREWHGIVLMWFAWDDAGPDWEMPRFAELDDADFYPFYPSGIHRWVLKGHCQQPMENAADFSHIHYVHGSGGLAEPTAMLCEKHRMIADVTVLYGRPDKQTTLTKAGGQKATIRLDHYGIGISVHRWGPQLWPACLVTSFTPIDEDHNEVAYHFGRQTGAWRERRCHAGQGCAHVQDAEARHRTGLLHLESWQAPGNALCAASEAPLYGRLRHWALQFYPETAAGYICPADDLSTLSSLDDTLPLDACVRAC